MYLPDEKCMNPYATVSCLECGACGREFEHGHIVRGGKTCGTCKYFDSAMSECDLAEDEGSFLSRHSERFVHRNDTCGRWEDSKE